MSFLAPLFLLGAAAFALPVVFHLIRRSPRRQKAFSSLMFLEVSAPRLTRRSRLEHILLLLLRCAVIGLLALAFARPFLKQTLPPAPSGTVARKSIILVDASASMKRDGLWQAARSRVESRVAGASPADEVAVFAYDRELRPLVTFEEWNATVSSDRVGLVRSRIANTEPGWAGTALDDAIIQAAERLAEDDPALPGVEHQVVVITDLQEGSRTSDLQTYAWPDGVTVQTERLMPNRQGNASVQWLAESGRDAELAVRLRINNAADSSQEQFRVGWAPAKDGGMAGEALEVYVPAGQSRVISLPSISTTATADNVVLLTGDEEPFDNRLFIIPPQKLRLKVLYLGADNEKDRSGPLYFLRRAFPDTATQETQVVPVKPGEPLTAGLVSEAALIVVTDPLSNAVIDELRKSAERGGTILCAPGTIASASTLAQLMGMDRLPMTEFVPADYGMLGEIDFRHPLFTPFADERFSDFTGIHFWKYRRIDESVIPNARVLARFDNEDPAMLDVPIGSGRLVILTSGWFPSDSQLALSSKFVPLLFSLLELGGKAVPPPAQCRVGDPLPLDSADAREVSVRGPDGAVVTLDAAAMATQPMTQPGVYSILASQPLRQFVVNLDPLESRTTPLPADELEGLGVPVPTASRDPIRIAQRRVTLHNAELEARQKYWRWAIVATLLLLVVETWLAGWTVRRTSLPENVNA